MPRPPLPWSLVFVALLACGGTQVPDAAGGSGGAGGGGGAPAVGGSGGAAGGAIDEGVAKLPCDVDAVIGKHCRSCHGAPPLYGAPSPLVTYDDLQQRAVTSPDDRVYEAMLERLRSASKPMPPPPHERLSIEELAIIDAWADEGLPPRAAGEVCAAPPPDQPPPAPPPCEPTIRLKSTSPWVMPKETTDRYVCYGIELPGSEAKRQITGIVPFIDNATIVHHLLLFQMDAPEPTTPHPCDEIFPITGKAIYAWAPGGAAYTLPEAAGFPVVAGESTHLMVQVHYSNLQQLEGQQDSSELGLCITDKVRPYDADIMWVGGYDFLLPPHSSTSVECTLEMKSAATQYLPIHVFQSWPHMHQLGTRLESTLVRPDGSTTPLGKADPYSFSDQAVYPMSADIYPGDKLLTRCTWNNTTDKSVKWGEATSEEMCFNLLAYYPKIGLPLYGSPAAAALSPCTTVE